MKIKTLAVSMVATVLISACDNSSNSKLITFSPDSLSNCEVGTEVLVKWDVKREYPDVKDVQIFVAAEGKELLFAEGTAEGESKTGPWVRPGTPRFIVKNKANNKELGSAVLNGSKCK